MMTSVYEQEAYRLLHMPAAAAGGIPVGYFRPAESPLLVAPLAELRLRHLQALERAISWPNQGALRARMFHTYEDFLLTSKYAKPLRRDGVAIGASLTRSAADQASYLRHLAEKDPDFAQFLHGRFPARLPISALQRHAYITGQSGSGKTELLKVLAYCLWRAQTPAGSPQPSLVIIDPHGDFAEEVAQWRPDDPERLIYLDPALRRDYAFGLNPLALPERTPEAAGRVAHELLNVFVELLKGAGVTFQMEALLIPCLFVLLLRPGSTLADLQRLMTEDHAQDLLDFALRSPLVPDHHKAFFRTGFALESYRLTKRSLYSRLQFLLNSPYFYHTVIGPNTLDLDAALSGRKRVVVNLAIGHLGAPVTEALGRFVIALIQSAMPKRAALPPAARTPVFLFVDEFALFVSRSTQTILTQGRKFGLHMILAQQYPGQDMDTHFYQAVQVNTAVKIAGRDERDEDLDALPIGVFRAKCLHYPAYTLHTPGFLLGRQQSLSPEAWAAVKADQLARYYRPIARPPVVTPAEPPPDGFSVALL